MAIITTPTTAKAWSPDIQGFVPGDAIPDALILTTATVAGVIEGDEPALLVPYVDDADAVLVAEGAPIPQANPMLAQAIVHTEKLAQVVVVSREQLLQPNASTLMMDSLRRSVTKAADRLYLTKVAPTAPAVGSTGLLEAVGVTDGGSVGVDLDSLTDAVAGIEGAGGLATHIIASPTAWAAMSKLKSGTGSAATLLGAGVQAGERFILGVPVLVTSQMAAGELLVIDRTAVVAAVGQVQVAQSEDAFFVNDAVAVRVTWRLGWTVMRPGRIAKLSTT